MSTSGAFPSYVQQQAPEMQSIERRKRLADALQAQSMAPVESGSAGGMVAPLSWTQGLAKALQAYAGKEQGRKADEEAIALQQKTDERRNADVGMLVAALKGREATPGGLVEDASGNVTQADPLPAQTPYQSLGQALPMMRDPGMQQLAFGAMQGQMPKRPEPFTLKKDEVRFDAEGRPLASGLPAADKGFTLAPGATRYDDAGKLLVSAPTRPEDNKPYFTPVQTGQGVMAFNARTGRMEPVQVGGAPVIGSASDPTLQGKISGAKTEAKERAEAQVAADVDLPRVIDNANNSLDLIDQMIGKEVGGVRGKPHPGFQSAVGMRVPGLGYIPGSHTADFNALLDQVKGGAFLQAFTSLKGGGAITEVEGKKATDAITRMQKAQSEREFIKAAREYQGVIRQGVQSAEQKAGMKPSTAQGNKLSPEEQSELESLRKQFGR